MALLPQVSDTRPGRPEEAGGTTTTMQTQRPAATIFDFDDTLCPTGPLWAGAIRSVCRAAAIPLEPLGEAWRGRSPEGVAELLAGIQTCGRDAIWSEALLEHTLRESLAERFAAAKLRQCPGAREAMAAASLLGPVAVASGCPQPILAEALRSLGLSEFVGCVLSSDQVGRPKPEPDVLFEAAACMGVDPGLCIVIEDSAVGAEAAAKARMRCYLVPSGALSQSHGAIVLADLGEVARELRSLAESADPAPTSGTPIFDPGA